MQLSLQNKELNYAYTNASSSFEGAKVLLNDTIQALKSRYTKGALVHLNILSQQLTALGNSSW